MSSRPGFALVLSLLLTLALMLLALGVLAVGTREATLALTVERAARARREAERAAVDVVRSWSTRAVSDLPVAGERPGGPATPVRTAVVVRIDSTLYLVRGEGRVPGPDGDVIAAAAVLVRTLAAVEQSAPAAITATGAVTVTAGAVRGSVADTAAGEAGPRPAVCDAPAPGILAPSITVEGAASVTGTPPIEPVAPPPTAVPDPLAPSMARRIADVRTIGSVISPRPAATGGECGPDPRNWGSPDPAHPCHSLLPLVFADTDLTVSGGTGRMVLVVNGDLRITDGAVLEGLIVVHGHVEVAGGSTVRGAIRARSVQLADGEVTRDGCVLVDAGSAPALDRAFRPPSRWWVPAF